MNIKTYVLESSVTGGTYDSIYKDIENIGEIFNVQDKADSFIKELKDRQTAITSKLESIKDHKTLLICIQMIQKSFLYILHTMKHSSMMPLKW